MSLESKIVLLITALEANTAARMGNGPATQQVCGTEYMPATATVPPTQTAVAQPVQNAEVVPAQAAVVPVTPTAAAQPAAASPSEQPALTLDQVQQEVTAIYQKLQGDPRVMQTINQFGASLSTIAPEQFPALIAAVRAL